MTRSKTRAMEEAKRSDEQNAARDSRRNSVSSDRAPTLPRISPPSAAQPPTLSAARRAFSTSLSVIEDTRPMSVPADSRRRYRLPSPIGVLKKLKPKRRSGRFAAVETLPPIQTTHVGGGAGREASGASLKVTNDDRHHEREHEPTTHLPGQSDAEAFETPTANSHVSHLGTDDDVISVRKFERGDKRMDGSIHSTIHEDGPLDDHSSVAGSSGDEHSDAYVNDEHVRPLAIRKPFAAGAGHPNARTGVIANVSSYKDSLGFRIRDHVRDIKVPPLKKDARDKSPYKALCNDIIDICSQIGVSYVLFHRKPSKYDVPYDQARHLLRTLFAALFRSQSTWRTRMRSFDVDPLKLWNSVLLASGTDEERLRERLKAYKAAQDPRSGDTISSYVSNWFDAFLRLCDECKLQNQFDLAPTDKQAISALSEKLCDLHVHQSISMAATAMWKRYGGEQSYEGLFEKASNELVSDILRYTGGNGKLSDLGFGGAISSKVHGVGLAQPSPTVMPAGGFRKRDNRKEKQVSGKKCFKCGKPGHIAKHCRSKKTAVKAHVKSMSVMSLQGALHDGSGYSKPINVTEDDYTFAMSLPDIVAAGELKGDFAGTCRISHVRGRAIADATGSVSLLLDSGASHHVVRDRRHFVTYAVSTGRVVFGNGSVESVDGAGDVQFAVRCDDGTTDVIVLRGALHVPKSSVDIVSTRSLVFYAGQLTGYQVRQGYKTDAIQLTFPSGAILTARIDEGLCFVDTVRSQGEHCGSGLDWHVTNVRVVKPRKTPIRVSLSVAHIQLDHISLDKVKQLYRTWSDAHGLNVVLIDDVVGLCGPCEVSSNDKHLHGFKLRTWQLEGETQSRPYREPELSATGSKVAHQLGSLVHCDIWSPGKRARGGSSCAVIFIEVSTRFAVVYLLKRKSQVVKALRRFRNHYAGRLNLGSHTVLRPDSEAVFLSERFAEAAEGLGGIKPTPPYAHEENGFVERLWHTVGRRVFAMIAQLGRNSWELWGYALLHAVWLYNNTPHSSLDGDSPRQRLNGELIELERVYTFGSNAYASIFTGNKQDDKARLMIWIGVHENGQHRLLDGATGRIYNAKFARVEDFGVTCHRLHRLWQLQLLDAQALNDDLVDGAIANRSNLSEEQAVTGIIDDDGDDAAVDQRPLSAVSDSSSSSDSDGPSEMIGHSYGSDVGNDSASDMPSLAGRDDGARIAIARRVADREAVDDDYCELNEKTDKEDKVSTFCASL